MTKSHGARADTAVLDQIADWLGGWTYDWDAGFAAYRAVTDRGNDGAHPSDPGADADASARARALVFVHRSHAVQTAMRAEAEGAAPELVVAALLHDIGHSFAAPAPRGREADYDDKHELVGALWLEQVFVDAVAQPVRLHVAAKRYLVATRPEYAAQLAPDSTLSLATQGGGMTPGEIAGFEAEPGWREAVRLRVWDDDAKHWSARIRPLDHYRPVIEGSLRT